MAPGRLTGCLTTSPGWRTSPTPQTTGQPKVVGAEHRAAAHYLLALRDAGHVRRDDIVLNTAATTFDASIRDIAGPLIVGARVVMPTDAERYDTRALQQLMSREQVTAVLSLVPATLRLLCAEPWPIELRPAPLRRLLVSGERFPVALARRAADFFAGAVVVNHYGPTECTMTATFHDITGAEAEPMPVGRPLPGMSVYILGPDREPVTPGQTGEIFIGWVGVSRGYLNRPDLTAEYFPPDPRNPGSRMYRTGDLGWINADGSLMLQGRIDDQRVSRLQHSWTISCPTQARVTSVVSGSRI
jgi:non-ribosomal peptide synthetase component F